MSDTRRASSSAAAGETRPAGLHRLKEPATGASIEITEPYFFLPRYMCGDLCRIDDRIEWRPNRIGRLWKLPPHSYRVADVHTALVMSASVVERKLAYLALYVGDNEY